MLLFQQPAPTTIKPVGNMSAGNTKKQTIPASGGTVPAPSANSEDRNPNSPTGGTTKMPIGNGGNGTIPSDTGTVTYQGDTISNVTPSGNVTPSLTLPEPDNLGIILCLVAFFAICCSFFFIYQSINLQKALFPTRKHRFINSEAIGFLTVAYILITITIWLMYVWGMNIDYIQSYDIQMRFYVYHPRLFLTGLLLGNLFPSSIALYASYLLHFKSKTGKDSSTKEVTKRASIFSLVFNLINLIGSIVTIFVFASTK